MLDYHTLYFGDLISYIVFSISLSLIGWRFRRMRGMRWFALSLGLTVVKTLLQTMRGRAPVALTILLANQLNVLSFVCMYLGFYWFCIRRSVPWGVLSFVGFVTVVIYPIAFGYGVSYHFVVGMSPVFLICILSIIMLLQQQDTLFRIPARIGAVMLTAHVIVLFYRTILIGFLYKKAPVTYAMSDQRWLYSYAAIMAIDMGLPLVYCSLMVVEMQRDLHREASTDPLTGVRNRRALLSEAKRLLEVCRRSNAELGLLVVDVDEFKKLNDTYGHAAGDAALVTLVGHLKACLPPFAFLARSGGEEFAVLLPSTGLLTAYEICEHVRKSMERAATKVEQQSFNITVSVGIAAFSGLGDDWEKMLHRADAAMYLAKERGRNCVCVDESEPTLLARTLNVPSAE